MTDRLTIAAYKTKASGGTQITIEQTDENDVGWGRRLAGPKHYNLGTTTLVSAELDEDDAREIRAMLDAVFPPAPLYVALYEGAAPALFSTPEQARAYCDDFAKAEARGRCWDWMPEKDGVQEQCWTHEDDDRPTYATGGTVTALRTDAEN